MAASFFTEDDLLGAVGGAAHGCELFSLKTTCSERWAEQPGAPSFFTEEDLLGAASGPAGSHERRRRRTMVPAPLAAMGCSAHRSRQVFFSCS